MKFIGRKAAWLVFCFLLGTALPGFSWGEEGHRIVAGIADKYLNAKARAEVERLLPGKSLEGIANFADTYRIYNTNTGPWHYVDIPLKANNYDRHRDCELHQGCLVEQLEIFKKLLTDSPASASNRAFALKFVVHLVGDLHQPLHCVDNDDRGGNSVKVTLFGEAKKSRTSSTHWNLHSVWDDGLIKHSGLDETNYVKTLTTRLDAATIKTLQAGTTLDWVMQSHSNATQFAYNIPANLDLDAEYYNRVKPVLNSSLLKGGVRLARLLNEALGR